MCKMFSTLKIMRVSELAGYKQEIITLLVYLVYLLAIPLVLRLLIPCLGDSKAYTYSECNIQLVLDKTIIVILIGFIITSLTYYLKVGRGKIKRIITIFFVLLTLSVLAYYVYLIPNTRKAYNNPVILTPTEEFNDVELNIE